MGRVLGASSQTASNSGSGGGSSGALTAFTNDVEDEDMNVPVTRQVLPPKSKCVASANGWIVAVVECCPPPTSSSSHNPQQQSQYASSRGTPNSSNSNSTPLVAKNGTPLTSLIPPLRLISRWNVRRNTSS